MNKLPLGKRSNAPQYVFTMVVSFAATVILTRYYLELTGYPQIGGGELHIAHLLWGGLALFIASLLPLIFANRRTYDWAAVLSGVGVDQRLLLPRRRADHLRRIFADGPALF